MTRPNSKRRRVIYDHSNNKSLTKQQFKEECDINNIMARFTEAGAATHFMKHAPEYGDVTEVDFIEAQRTIANTTSMFEELPAKMRADFHNNPAEFLQFVNTATPEQLAERGLTNPGDHTYPHPSIDPRTEQGDLMSPSPSPDNPQPSLGDSSESASSQQSD